MSNARERVARAIAGVMFTGGQEGDAQSEWLLGVADAAIAAHGETGVSVYAAERVGPEDRQLRAAHDAMLAELKWIHAHIWLCGGGATQVEISTRANFAIGQAVHATGQLKPVNGFKWQLVPDYPTGTVVGACICGSWPGGECLKCPPIYVDYGKE